MTDQPVTGKGHMLNFLGTAIPGGNECPDKTHQEEPDAFQVPVLYLCNNFNLPPSYS